MAYPNVANDAAAAIATTLAASPSSLTYGSNVRPGPLCPPDTAGTKPVPERCVFVLQTMGLNDIPYLDGGSKTSEKRLGLQITIRSPRNDYDNGLTLALAVWAAIDKTPPSGYSEARAFGSGPGYVGKDSSGCHIFSINVIVTHDPT